jgi:hypothetical protein
VSELRISLQGQDAFLGRVPARDVANLLITVELAVMRAASVVLNRPKAATGRAHGHVEQAARFRLKAIEEGSVIPVLELPEPATTPDQLDIEVASLAETAVERLLSTLALGDGHPIVAGALLEIADKLRIGERYDAVTFDFRSVRATAPQKAELDRGVSDRLRQVVERERMRIRDDALVGTLVEADFERNTARLRGPLNEAITVSFSDDLADDIQDALRRNATLIGKIEYDPGTLVARRLTASSIMRGRQLSLDIDDDAFWRERTFAELAADQGIVPADDPGDIFDADASDAEREAFMAALAELD